MDFPLMFGSSPQNSIAVFVDDSNLSVIDSYPVALGNKVAFINLKTPFMWLKENNNGTITTRQFELKDVTPIPEKPVTREEMNSLNAKVDKLLELMQREDAS